MALTSELVKRLKNKRVTDEEVISCLESENYRVVAMAMFIIIERNYCDERIVNMLTKLSRLLGNNKFIGPWQLGHVAIATLSLLDNESASSMFNEIFEELDDIDKFLVDNFIESDTEMFKKHKNRKSINNNRSSFGPATQ